MDRKSLLATLALLATPAVAAAAGVHPACDAKHAGQFWPDPKTTAATIQQLARSGELEVCSRKQEWHYGWARLTITLDQLQSQSKKAASAPVHRQEQD